MYHVLREQQLSKLSKTAQEAYKRMSDLERYLCLKDLPDKATNTDISIKLEWWYEDFEEDEDDLLDGDLEDHLDLALTDGDRADRELEDLQKIAKFAVDMIDIFIQAKEGIKQATTDEETIAVKIVAYETAVELIKSEADRWYPELERRGL